jgi:putative addiction module component (TIGR02574 family)
MDTIESIEWKMLQLKPNARARLAHSLVQSLDNLSEAELESLWLAEAQRRDGELESGAVKGVPGEQVFKRIRSRYGS